jgi:plastocyanin
LSSSADVIPVLHATVSRRGRLVAAALALAMAAVTPAAGAQASLTGRLELLERPGAARADVATALVYLQSLGDTPVAPFPADPGLDADTIAMRGRKFVPHVRVVRAGGTVSFPNRDPFSHNVFSNSALGAFDLGLYRRGASRSATFQRPGVYPIYCNIHHRMVSFVVAAPTPHVARPGADGRFTLTGIAPGTYLLRAWHERALEVSQRVVVGAGGATEVHVVLDAREYVPAPHLNKFGLPYTVTRADRY